MAVKKQQLKHDSETAQRRPIELITENGFSIVRASDLDRVAATATGIYAFLVRDPHDYELEITVEIAQAFRNEIGLQSRGRISGESSYWICCAERHLADYLWENGDYPPDATLEVAVPNPRDVDLAHRWDRNT